MDAWEGVQRCIVYCLMAGVYCLDAMAPRSASRAAFIGVCQAIDVTDNISESGCARHRRALRRLHRLVVRSLRFGAYILATLLVARFWHLVGPRWAGWQLDVDLQAVDKMLFSSAFGGFVLSYLKDTISSK